MSGKGAGSGEQGGEPRLLKWRTVVRALLICSLLPVPCSLPAQDRIRQQRNELERIRQERAELERQMRDLQTTAHDLGEDVRNLDRRADATARLVVTLDRQLQSIASEVDEAADNMMRAEAELSQKKLILRRRLVDIYKRGPLYTAQALLSAASFGELVARYKYLHLLALRDRALVRRVEQLRNQVALERDRLVVLQRSIRDNREEKQLEEGRLRALEQQQRLQLARVRQETKQTQNKIARMRLTETQLTNAINALEVERRRAVASARRPAAAPRATSSVRTSDYGKLDWPVEGPLVYTYGRAVQPNNTTIRWNGVGISAAVGTPVKSVATGTVVQVQPIGTYGLTVIIEHGGGDYSIYGSLSRADVRKGQTVAKGQSVGGVGVSDPELPPHLHFEIRQGGPAIDPATWLRRR
ncbi:MAG: peptidoglycan DD-metalloendopeptidase family protein [Gemmatimonadaceae bacterium]